jgi:hypothetical protein
MLQLSYTYFVHDIEQVRKIRKAISGQLKSHPLYILQIGKCIQLQFDAHEDAYFIDEIIASEFIDYEFITDLSNGNEEILLSITRIQSPDSGDGWGRRWNEDSLISEKHLVKKRERSPAPVPYLTFGAFFGDQVKDYQVHLGYVPDEGYVVVDGPFGEGLQPKTISTVFPNKTAAFWAGKRLLEPKVEADFAAYQKKQRRRKTSKN